MNGHIDSHRLRHDAIDEPFPVEIMIRGKAYKDRIMDIDSIFTKVILPW